MAAKRKDFTKADAAVDKFFTQQIQNAQEDNNTYNLNRTEKTTTEKTTTIKQTQATHKSKHYDDRGKRGERFGLLLDKQLKDDLTHLSMAKGSKSTNDFIVTVLLDYVEQDDNQTRLRQYRKLLKR